MFTGIIEQTGKIQKIDGNRFTVSHGFAEKIEVGESIALSGTCVTVLSANEEAFTVEIMAESRDRTTFANAHVGDTLNLERSAIIGARNSGHFVTGHIDEAGKILKISKVGDYRLLRISFSPANARFVVEKGSVAIDGISLTVSKGGEDWLEVALISHTWSVTNLSQKKVGDIVNLEFDILGKYILNAKR